MMNLYDISINTLEGEDFKFSKLKEKKVLIVNTASACGLTGQYKQLQELHSKYQDKVAVIGVPSNDFAGQESGTPSEILHFCTTNYQVSFPLLEKVNTKSDPIHPLYQFLTQRAKNGLIDNEVKWNFQKYILNETGFLTHVFDPQVEVFSNEILTALDISL